MAKDEAVKKIVAWAKAQLGYKPTYGKLNKYAEYMDKQKDYYNTPKNGADWCDVFVDCGFAQSFGLPVGRLMIYQPLKSTGAGVYFSMGFYRQNNAFYDTPEVGDQIFYGALGDHTGLVVAVTKSYVTTIEGNWNNQVCQRKLAKTDYRIEGYGRPNWALVADQEAPKDEPVIEPQFIEYKVKAGDTLGTVAEKFGTTVSQIVKDNGIPNPNVIYVGEVFKIRTAKEPEDNIEVGDTVKLRKGAKTYYGGALASFVYRRKYKVVEISGDRAVISYGGQIVAAVKKDDLTRV